MPSLTRYDFCLAWNWEYDADFASILANACLSRNLALLSVTPDNLGQILEDLSRGEVAFSAFLDRASEADPQFQPLVDWARRCSVYRINPQENALRAMNKASMHLEFISAGIHTPYTIILPPFRERPELPLPDLSPLGRKFIIKPAHGGGGEGVVADAVSFFQAQEARQAFPHDYYLLQAHIEPSLSAGRPAWFRVIFCGGRVFPCWWDPTTHVYEAVSPDEAQRFGLAPLTSTTLLIGRICGLDMFSTEIALTPTGRFVSVDYVNDQIDLRPQSKACDGVPDEIIRTIAATLAEMVIRHSG